MGDGIQAAKAGHPRDRRRLRRQQGRPRRRRPGAPRPALHARRWPAPRPEGTGGRRSSRPSPPRARAGDEVADDRAARRLAGASRRARAGAGAPGPRRDRGDRRDRAARAAGATCTAATRARRCSPARVVAGEHGPLRRRRRRCSTSSDRRLGRSAAVRHVRRGHERHSPRPRTVEVWNRVRPRRSPTHRGGRRRHAQAPVSRVSPGVAASPRRCAGAWRRRRPDQAARSPRCRSTRSTKTAGRASGGTASRRCTRVTVADAGAAAGARPARRDPAGRTASPSPGTRRWCC